MSTTHHVTGSEKGQEVTSPSLIESNNKILRNCMMRDAEDSSGELRNDNSTMVACHETILMEDTSILKEVIEYCKEGNNGQDSELVTRTSITSCMENQTNELPRSSTPNVHLKQEHADVTKNSSICCKNEVQDARKSVEESSISWTKHSVDTPITIAAAESPLDGGNCYLFTTLCNAKVAKQIRSISTPETKHTIVKFYFTPSSGLPVNKFSSSQKSPPRVSSKSKKCMMYKMKRPPTPGFGLRLRRRRNSTLLQGIQNGEDSLDVIHSPKVKNSELVLGTPSLQISCPFEVYVDPQARNLSPAVKTPDPSVSALQPSKRSTSTEIVASKELVFSLAEKENISPTTLASCKCMKAL